MTAYTHRSIHMQINQQDKPQKQDYRIIKSQR